MSKRPSQSAVCPESQTHVFWSQEVVVGLVFKCEECECTLLHRIGLENSKD